MEREALVLALMGMVVDGVSTRKARVVVEKLCGVRISKSTVPDICKQCDPIVKARNERDLSEKEYPFLVVDALIIKVCTAGRVRTQSVLVACRIKIERFWV